MKRIAAALAALLASVALAASPPARVDAAERSALGRATIEELQKSYVFPEVAARMAADLRERERAGEYAAIEDPGPLARKLTDDLQALSRDRHLRVFETSTPAEARPYTAPANHGFEKVERLPGNIGYLEVRSFLGGAGPAVVEATAEAMTALADTDALIVDLRRNGGGSPHMVALVSSYLFDGRVHLNSLYWREGDRTDEFWTSAEVRGKRFGQSKPVYVLTSERTFSGAEEFTYNLKNLKRATIVGERTGGGAHPGAVRKLTERFSMFVATGRAVSPITGTNWEGTGVEPDVEVPARDALDKALELAAKATSRAS
jgi:C-terminal processing protease CtpA/Prc